MVQIIPVAPNPAFEGLSRLAEAIGARLNPEMRAQLEQQQLEQQFRQQLLQGRAPEGDGIQSQAGPLAPVFPSGQNIRSQITDAQLLAAASSPSQQTRQAAAAELQLRKMETEQRKVEQQRQKPFVQADISRAGKFLEEVDSEAALIVEQDALLDLMEAQVKSRNLGPGSRDDIASRLGFLGKFLVTEQGALSSQAVKEWVISDLKNVKGRPNQWLEQQIASVVGGVGFTEQANLAMQQGLRMKNRIKQARIDITDEMEAEFRSRGEPIPGNIRALVEKELRVRAEEIQGETARNLKEISERSMSNVELSRETQKKQKQGTPLTPRALKLMVRRAGSREQALANAKKQGYDVSFVDQQVTEISPEELDQILGL